MYSAVIVVSLGGVWKTVAPPPESGFQSVNLDTIDLHTCFKHLLKTAGKKGCSKYVRLKYIKEQIQHNNIFIVVYNNNNPVGFIMANFTENNGIYLDVICALEGQGGPLLNMFISVCQNYFKASYIKLSSLMHVLTYYPRLGFSHRKSCAEPPSVIMTPELSKYIVENLRAGKLHIDDTFFDDPYIGPFIAELHKQGYTRTEKPKCADRNMSIEEQKSESCGEDGYTMIKCLDPPAHYPVPIFIDIPMAKSSAGHTDVMVLLGLAAPTKVSRELQSLISNPTTLPPRRKTAKRSTGTMGRAASTKGSISVLQPRRRTVKKSTGTMGRALRGSRGIRTSSKSTRKSGTSRHPASQAITLRRLKTVREEM
jgi:hypothetical protein